ncbi:helix-turn-helix domain-containing protein [Paraburkholderia sediminicola]|uniref:helix-turn-helix domain-containing protein n=1 Tax=Paraburkholderia sediminicola TaxID=458836 RepID=UPI0038BC5057
MNGHLSPERTAFHLKPVRCAGSARQKLTDYVVQIANNSLLPFDVIVMEMVRWPACIDGLDATRRPFASGQHLALANAHGETARYWVQRLTDLTGQTDLEALTLLPFAGVLRDPFGLVGHARRWCPVCLQDDLLTGAEIYERLIWSIRLVERCPIHDVPLTSECPNCQYRHCNETCRRSISGYCARCHHWLGASLSCYRRSLRRRSRNSSRQKWLANEFASLLDVPDTTLIKMSQENAVLMLESGIDRLAGGSAKRFASKCGKSPSSLSEWRAGLVIPSIQTILDICEKFQIRLVDWLCANSDAWPVDPERRKHTHGYSPRRTAYLERDWSSIERKLRTMADSDRCTLSWKQTAEKLGIDPSQLHAKFPELAGKISRKAREHRTRDSVNRREARRTVLLGKLKQIVRKMLVAGIDPTRRRVEAELTKHGIEYRWADYPLIAQARHEVDRAIP